MSGTCNCTCTNNWNWHGWKWNSNEWTFLNGQEFKHRGDQSQRLKLASLSHVPKCNVGQWQVTSGQLWKLKVWKLTQKYFCMACKVLRNNKSAISSPVNDENLEVKKQWRKINSSWNEHVPGKRLGEFLRPRPFYLFIFLLIIARALALRSWSHNSPKATTAPIDHHCKLDLQKLWIEPCQQQPWSKISQRPLLVTRAGMRFSELKLWATQFPNNFVRSLRAHSLEIVGAPNSHAELSTSQITQWKSSDSKVCIKTLALSAFKIAGVHFPPR